MSSKFSLDGGMIPRTVKRVFDQRIEPRVDGELQSAVLNHRGNNHVIRVGNISASGVMISYAGMPFIGETVSLQLLDHGTVKGQVRWVRDGRVGINFLDPIGR